MIINKNQFIILSIGCPVKPDRYLSGPNSLETSLFTLTSKIRFSKLNIESLTTSILDASFSFSLDVDSIFFIAALLFLITKLPFLSVY